jgi:predicted nicotinamide N-methyase
MRIAPIPWIPEIRLYTAHKASGLSRLGDPQDRDGEPQAPYWAFPWAGGMALARHILDRPETVAGRRVLDLGSGSGLVAIAAALAGAPEVLAADIDRYAVAAIALNAEANAVTLSAIEADPTGGPPPAADLVLVGDLYYDRDLAAQVTPFLDRCLAAGIGVLIGDPGRAYLPRSRLRLVAEYAMPDIGVENAATKPSAVYALEA